MEDEEQSLCTTWVEYLRPSLQECFQGKSISELHCSELDNADHTGLAFTCMQGDDHIFKIHLFVFQGDTENTEYEDTVHECLTSTFNVIQELVESTCCRASLAARTHTCERKKAPIGDMIFHSYRCRQYILFPNSNNCEEFLHVHVFCLDGTSEKDLDRLCTVGMHLQRGSNISETIVHTFFPDDTETKEKEKDPSFRKLTWFPVVRERNFHRNVAIASSQHKKSHASPLHALDDNVLHKIANMSRGIHKVSSPDLLKIIDSWERDWQKTLEEYSEFGAGSFKRGAELPVGNCMVCARCSRIITI